MEQRVQVFYGEGAANGIFKREFCTLQLSKFGFVCQNLLSDCFETYQSSRKKCKKPAVRGRRWRMFS